MLDRHLWKSPMIIAHRGSRDLWPENTMIAFENAVALGAEHIETDIHVSADGVVFCFHDHTLDRITGASGLISDMTASEIQKLDAAFNHRGPGGFDSRSTGVKVPTFEELALSFPEVRIVVDLKQAEVVQPFARLVDRLGIGARLIVGSFSDRRLDHFRSAVSGDVATSTGYAASRRWLIASRRGRPVPGPAAALQLPLQMRGLRVVDGKLVDTAHDAGLQLHVWTVNDAGEMERLFALGVDAVITDRPDRGFAVLSR
jgi:glycerophosphoryl diester phosphodiesterase